MSVLILTKAKIVTTRNERLTVTNLLLNKSREYFYIVIIMRMDIMLLHSYVALIY